MGCRFDADSAIAFKPGHVLLTGGQAASRPGQESISLCNWPSTASHRVDVWTEDVPVANDW